MQPITILPRFPEQKPDNGYLVNEKWAILKSHGSAILTRVNPTEDPDVYTPMRYVHVSLAERGDHAEMVRVVDKLHEMSAFTLLTEHFNVNEERYYINQKMGE